ncbi:restriction endonuclease subunit S [Streptococcus suis]|uniref:restriction endonuclease subunit S n=1 Tax=Streptococcus suis TaxID=1307 RepID=UPI001C96B047|nr:restriction endonuclease subunit S [Streptococcus suis]MBY5024703.1 restriction endonuclease subunit S [Streptococcus suis]QZT17745.1 restriction endonuclease subunit S [Streptococcus suis]
MNHIEKMLQDYCPNGVEWKELGEVCDTVVSPIKLKRNEYQSNGAIAIIDQGEEFVAGYIDIEKYLPKDEYVIFGDHSEHIKFVNFPFVQGADGLKILKSRQGVIPKFLYYCFCNFYKKEGNYKRHWSVARTTPIPIPPLEIQKEIVQILDKFTEYVTELTAELTAELTLRQKQYTYFRDYLLNFDQDSSGGANNKVYKVEWKTLGEILIKGRGTKVTAGQMKELHKDGAPIRIFAGGKTFADVDYGDIPEKDVHHEEAIIVKSRGIIDFEYYTKPFSFKNEFWSYSSDSDDVNLRYVYHYLNHNKSHFQHIAGNMQMPQISSNDTEKYKIPLPTKTVQSRIVQVLDNFDAVCNDLNIGLPKEIELRQKQYEYFREKLLTFTAEGVYTDSTVQYRQDLIRLLNWVFGPIRVELGAICEFTRGNGLQKKDFTEEGFPVIHYGQIYTRYGFSTKDTVSFTSQTVFDKLKKAQSNDIVMATTSENVEDVGKAVVWEGEEVIGVSGDSYIIQTSQNARYLNYFFKSVHFQSQKEKKVTGTKVIRITAKDMGKFVINIPSLEDQSRIVSILDTFDNLTSSIAEGLPKEIELRQKQYEYFRDQLLNFS